MSRKKNHILPGQKNFYFEDYNYIEDISKSSNDKIHISFNRVSFIFFIFVIAALIYSSKIIYLASVQSDNYFINKPIKFTQKIRQEILDRNGNVLAKNVIIYSAGIRTKLILDKEKLLVNLKIIFPSLDIKKIRKKMNSENFFYLEKRLKESERKKLWSLGDKSIQLESKNSRMYPHRNLFSHVLGQIDEDNFGISGIEKKFDNKLRDSSEPLKLSLDTNLQFLIREELLWASEIFKTKGSAALLMNVNNGEILSFVSLPDYDLNSREKIEDPRYLNKITKGVYELGSVFKTFTLAAALDLKVVSPDTLFKNLESKIKCSKYIISEHDPLPKNLTAEQILIRSSNIGSIRIAQMVGLEKFKKFLNSFELFDRIDFDLEEIGTPHPIKWGKCKLATASYGHGITTTLIQLARAYSILGNGGYKIDPTLIRSNLNKNFNEKIISSTTSKQINSALRKVVFNEEGTANFANIKGYDIAGKTGTALKYGSKDKNNTFVSLFPSSDPKFVLAVLLEEPKLAPKEYIFKRPDGKKYKSENVHRNTSGWNTVVVAGKIIEKIGPILAINNLQASKNY